MIIVSPIGVNVVGISTGLNPVTHTALVETNKESTQPMPSIVLFGSINKPEPIIIIVIKLPASIKAGFVFFPNKRINPLDRLRRDNIINREIR